MCKLDKNIVEHGDVEARRLLLFPRTAKAQQLHFRHRYAAHNGA